MTEPTSSGSNALRTTREALVAQLLGDVDRLLDRVDTIAPAIVSAAARLELATQALQSATRANSEAAKASVGQYITRRTNEAVSAARLALLEAATTQAEHRDDAHATQPRSGPCPTTPGRRVWPILAGAATAVVLVTTSVLLTLVRRL